MLQKVPDAYRLFAYCVVCYFAAHIAATGTIVDVGGIAGVVGGDKKWGRDWTGRDELFGAVPVV